MNEKQPSNIDEAGNVSYSREILHVSHEVPPPENLELVASPLESVDEIVPIGDAENSDWVKIVGYINKIDSERREKQKAITTLGIEHGNKFTKGSVQVANKIERQLGEFSDDEKTLTREDVIEKRKLIRDQELVLDREAYAKEFIDTKEDSIGGNIELALRNFETLPEELQGAIRTGDKTIFAKYEVNPWAAKQVGHALEERERREEKRVHEESIARKEKLAKVSAAIMAGEFASVRRADIEEALQERGISISNIGEGLKIFKEQYEQNNKRATGDSRTKEPRTLIDRVRYAESQGETIPEHTVQSMLKSAVPREHAWAEAEIAKRTSVIAVPEAPDVAEVEVPIVAVAEEIISPEIPTAEGIKVEELEIEEITISPIASQEEQIESLRAQSSRSEASRRLRGLQLLDDVVSQENEINPVVLGHVMGKLEDLLPQTVFSNESKNMIAQALLFAATTDAVMGKKRFISTLVDMEISEDVAAKVYDESIQEEVITTAEQKVEVVSPVVETMADEHAEIIHQNESDFVPVENTVTPETPQPSVVAPLSSPYDVALEKRWNERGGAIEAPDLELVPMDEEQLNTEVAQMETLVVNNEVPPFMGHKLRHTWEIVDEKYAAMGVLAATAVGTESREVENKNIDSAPIHNAITKQFQEKFGINEHSLENIEAFKGLSDGQKVLVLKNLEQLTLSDITKEAKVKQKEEWGNTSWWKKGLQSIVTLGMAPTLRTAEIEKELLTQTKGGITDITEAIRQDAKKLAYIESLAKVAAVGPDAEIKDGELLIKYVSSRDIFDSLEDKKLTGEGLLAIETFNTAASDLAKLPHEWKYSTTELKGKELALFTQKEKAYADARASMIAVYEKKFSAQGEKNPEKHAMLELNKLDERVALNQLFNTHPDAEQAIANIKDKSIISRAAKEFWKAKGNFIAYGIAGRAAVVSAVGALIPPVGVTMLAIGAVTGAGYLVGKNIGNKEGERLMKERRVDGRMSEEDERELIKYEQYKTENGKRVLDEEGNPIVTGVATRNIKEFTDATFFVDRIDRLVSKLDTTTDETQREMIEKKIVQTTTLMSEKLVHGMINFGGSGLERGDERKGDTIANRLSFMQAMAKGTIETSIDQAKLDEEMETLVGLRESRIEESRKSAIKHIARKAALLRGGFALAGATIAEIASQYIHVGSTTPETSAGYLEGVAVEGEMVSPAELAYASDMSVQLNRPLSLIEARALWKTDSMFADANPDFTNAHVLAHRKLIDAFIAKPSLSQAEINDIYKSVGFDEARGNNFPEVYDSAAPSRQATYEQVPKVAEVIAPVIPTETVQSPSVPSEAPGMLHRPQPEVTDIVAPQLPKETIPSAVVPEIAPRVLTANESMQAIANVEANIGRDMSGGEMVVVKGLKKLEMNAKDVSELAGIGEARIALVGAMSEKGTALSPTEMHNIMRQFSLEQKVNIIPDAELRKTLGQF